jgi:hypothetical protein
MPTMSVVIQNCVTHQLLGVATSARQFFMQIGNVLGVAVFGVVLATSYSSAFDDNLNSSARSVLPEHILAEFDDPTLALDERRFPAVREEVLALAGGQAALDSALAAQKEGVATAIPHIYTWSTILVLGALLLVFFLKEIPLRRSFQPVEPAAAEAETGAVASTGPMLVPPGRRRLWAFRRVK